MKNVYSVQVDMDGKQHDKPRYMYYITYYNRECCVE